MRLKVPRKLTEQGMAPSERAGADPESMLKQPQDILSASHGYTRKQECSSIKPFRSESGARPH